MTLRRIKSCNAGPVVFKTPLEKYEFYHKRIFKSIRELNEKINTLHSQLARLQEELYQARRVCTHTWQFNDYLSGCGLCGAKVDPLIQDLRMDPEGTKRKIRKRIRELCNTGLSYDSQREEFDRLMKIKRTWSNR